MDKKEPSQVFLEDSVIVDNDPEMSALSRSASIQTQAAAINFDWQCTEDVMDKLREEVDELAVEIEKNDKAAMQDEMGDILFTCVNLSRHLGIDLEQSLQGANDKFLRRFVKVEQICRLLSC